MNDSAALPRLLGRYELVHQLGQGGMGEVYLAKISGAAGFEKPCIVKTILPALLKDRQFLDRFHHEAKVLVHLVHSSIAQVYDMGEAGNTYYMALEYVAGVDLAFLQEQARAQGKPLPLEVALYLGQHICEGLGYAHRKMGPDGQPLGIVHRDVSPHNVMLSYEGEVKVIDFGLAKSAARSKYTLPSTVMGKLGYMSPEQVRAEPVDHRSDIYSCGVVVWELLAGQPLFAHGTVGEMMAAMSNPVVPSLHELRPDVDPALDAVVRRALAPLPEERYARADDFARALNEQLLRLGSTLGAEEVGECVRAFCPEAFASQRRILSRLTSSPGLRRTPLPLGPTGQPLTTGLHAAEDAAGFGFASTMVRPDSRTALPIVPSPEAAHGQGPGRKGWTAAIVLGALGLIGASAGVTAALMNQPPPSVQMDERPPPPPHYEGELHADRPRPPPPPHEVGPPPHPGGEFQANRPRPPPPPHEVGPPPPPPEFAPPPPVGEPKAVVDASTPRPASPAVPAVRLVPATHVVAMRPGPDKSFIIPGGREKGLSPGMVIPVVAAPVREGKARLLGEATVLKVGERRAVVSADARVRGASRAERFVVLPDVVPARFEVPADPSSVKPPPVASEPLPNPKDRVLKGRIADRSFSPLRKTLELTNTDPFSWSHCILVVNGREMVNLGGVGAGVSRPVQLSGLKKGGPQVPFVEKNRVGLFCDEGRQLLPMP